MMKFRICAAWTAVFLFGMLMISLPMAQAGGKRLILASTTSAQASGLYGHILPRFTAETGQQVEVIAVGTGKAIKLAERGDADMLLVHHPESEREFMEAGYGIERHPLFHNRFVIIGPATDPAGVKKAKNAAQALQFISHSPEKFISRGDESGTHKKEQELWTKTGLNPINTMGQRYIESGQGMGPVLNIAVAMNAYTLCDRATWLNFGNKGNLQVVFDAADPDLYNPYSLILVNPNRHHHINHEGAKLFRDWLLSDDGKRAVMSLKVNGQQLFEYD